MKTIFCIVLVSCLLIYSHAQNFYLEKIIDLSPDYRAITSIATVCSDNGIYLAAKIRNSTNQDKFLFCSKLDCNFDTIWTSIIGLEDEENPRKAIETSDHGCLIMGNTLDDLGYDVILVIKYDSDGIFLWKKQINPGFIMGTPDDIIASDDNTVFLSGGCWMNGEDRAFFMKVSPNGTSLWTKYYLDLNLGGFCTMDTTADGNFVLGYAGAQDMCYRIAKVNPFGNLIWNKWYPSSFMDIAFDIVTTPDGGFFQIGYSYDMYNDGLLINRTNSNGVQIWTQTISDNYSFYVERAGNLYFVFSDQFDILKLDENANLLSITPFKEEYFNNTSVHFYKTNQDHFLFTAVIQVLNSDFEKIFIGLSDLLTNTDEQPKCSENLYSIIPNPFHDCAEIFIPEESLSHDVSLTIYNGLGWMVKNLTLKSSKTPLLSEYLNKGIYIYRITRDDTLVYSGKFIVN
jgi:hypothetical protein